MRGSWMLMGKNTQGRWLVSDASKAYPISLVDSHCPPLNISYLFHCLQLYHTSIHSQPMTLPYTLRKYKPLDLISYICPPQTYQLSYPCTHRLYSWYNGEESLPVKGKLNPPSFPFKDLAPSVTPSYSLSLICMSMDHILVYLSLFKSIYIYISHVRIHIFPHPFPATEPFLFSIS